MASNVRREFKHPRIMATVDDVPQTAELEQITGIDELRPKISAVMWRGVKLVIRDVVSLSEFEKLVSIIVDQCWNGEYYQISLMDFAIRCGVIACYTNLALSDDAEKTYLVLYETDLYDTVCAHISKAQLDALTDAVKIILNH